jgi:hypothetical protein
MPALPKNVGLDPDGVSVWKSYILPAEEFALKKEGREAKYKDDLIGVRIVGGFLLDFYQHANIIETGHTPYKRMLLEIKSCFKSVPVTDDEANFKAIFQLGLDYRNYFLRVCE